MHFLRMANTMGRKAFVFIVFRIMTPISSNQTLLKSEYFPSKTYLTSYGTG